MELFRTCSQCGVAIEEKRIATRASQMRIHWTCLKGHTGEWSSFIDHRQMARNNLLVCAATFFMGATFSVTSKSGLNWTCKSQAKHSFMPSRPNTWSLWLIHTRDNSKKFLIEYPNFPPPEQDLNFVVMQGVIALVRIIIPLTLGDFELILFSVIFTYWYYVSPKGYSSKYSTYSLQDDATKEIVYFELVQVNCA